MPAKASVWIWRCIWVVSLLIGLGVFWIYSWLPVDGATGDMESFTPGGFKVQWLLEERQGSPLVGDIIVRAGGYTVDEWLSGAPRGPEWETSETVRYEILRNGQRMSLQVRMAPIPLQAILSRWGPQLLASIGLLIVGGYVFIKRAEEMAARLLMLFCTMVAIQTWGDAYNFQYAILTRRSIFWYHFFLEYSTFVLIYASILHFVLIFPAPHPLVKRYPRLTILTLYLSHPLIVAVVMSFYSPWSRSLKAGSRASWIVALCQVVLAIAVGVRSVRTVRDPVNRAQVRWILWGAGVVLAAGIPGYILPLALSGQPLIPHPVVMMLTVFIIVVFAFPILRYRLFDIEIVINRTLVYGTLTVLLGGLYFLLVRLLTLGAQIAARYQNETLVVFLATLSIALLFNSLRQRVQDLIDRAFYRQKLNYQRLLPEMAGRLTTSILPDQLTQLMTEELPRRLQIQKASLLVLDPGGKRLDPLHAGAHSTRPVDFLLIEVLKRLARPFLRLQPDSRLPEALLGWLEVNQIELVIPLMVGEELVGVYSLGPKLSGDVYNAEEVRLLNLLGQQAAVGIQNSRLFQAEQRQRKLAEALGERMTRLANEARRRAAHQVALNEVITIAVTAPDLDHLLEEALNLTLQALELNMGALWVTDKMVSRGLSPDFRQEITQTVEARGAEVSVVMIMDDWEATADGHEPQTEGHKMRAWLVAPLLAGGVSIGALCVVSVTPRDWHPGEVALVEAIGRQLGGAVERLDLLARTQEQARQVQQIIDTVPEGVLLLDGNREVVLANPAAWQHLVHLTGQDCVGRPLPSLAGLPLDRLLNDDSDRPWHEVVSEGPLRRIFEMAAHPLQSQSGGSGWVLVIRDVTLVRETQDQIQMQERLATVGQLAAGIAHDFNNIMAAILVYADLLTLEADVSDLGRERLDIIQNQIRRATSLIRQILDFSRRGVMEKTVLDLLPLAKELEKLLQRVLPENIRLKLTYQPGEYLVDADPTRLQQVFMNLSLNARDAMPFGGTLRFDLSRFKLQAGERPPYPDLTPGDWICIRVRDTGTGIPVDIQSRIFDPFFTTKPVGKGTGLGLAQVYGIIKGHGGSIDLQSKIGEGTIFSIYLPRQTAPLEEQTEAEPVTSIGTGQTVLLVEDDQATRKAICDLMESMNYRVLVATNGVDALQVYDCESETIRLVVLDVVMPEMGGVPLYEALKEKNPQLKVVFVSGHPFSIEDQSILEGGQVQWLQKPFSVQEFAALVSRMLEE